MTQMHWTIGDLQRFPDPIDDTRYEIIDGRLKISQQPHWRHQLVVSRVVAGLEALESTTGVGYTLIAPGIVLSDDTVVAPDAVWIARDRFGMLAGDDGDLHGAPDLIVEVLSLDQDSREWDVEVKTEAYSRYDVGEYWIVDWQTKAVKVLRRSNRRLQEVGDLAIHEALNSPMLPGFGLPLSRLFAKPL